MHVRLGSTDSPQDHVVVYVVSHVPDRYVLEQMTTPLQPPVCTSLPGVLP